ncbi:MAG: hypothetical protein ABL999_12550 [Pyrinomonadaceae bacterium]
MKKLLPFFLLIFPILTVAQTPVDLPIMGEVSQIVGKTKIYVAGATSDERKIIIKAFDSEKKKIPFVIVGDPAEAELFMNFGELTRMTNNTAFNRNYQERDELEVYYINDDKKKVIVFTDTETLDASGGLILSFPNSWNLTKNFFKAYNKMLKAKAK